MTNDEGANELVIQLMQASSSQLNLTTNALLESYREDAITGQVTLDLIRNRIDDLFSGAYQPSQAMILRALYPAKSLIDELVQQRMSEQ
jgi:hypothetical protein